jgi:hypothetical protein
MMIYDHIKIESKPFLFDLSFKSDITIIGGDSGTGKTFLYYLLEALRTRKEYENIILYDYKNSDMLSDGLQNHHNKLIVIDNADIILNDNHRCLLSTSRDNQYLIFGRLLEGLLLNADSHQILKGENNHFTLEGVYG